MTNKQTNQWTQAKQYSNKQLISHVLTAL